MSHPEIYFRESELKAISNKYFETKIAIDSHVDIYFGNVNSIDNLYYLVDFLENKENIYDSFENSSLAIENFGKLSVQNSREVESNPFSYSPFKSFDPTSSKGGFYIGFGLLIIFIVVAIKKLKITKFIGFLLLIAIGLNLYNYYVKEPQLLNSKAFYLNPTKYEKYRFAKIASEKYEDLYQPQRTYSTSRTYEYEVDGINEYGDYVEGSVETSGKYGEGYILNEYGEEIGIEVEWTGKGELMGTDEDNNKYELSLKH